MGENTGNIWTEQEENSISEKFEMGIPIEDIAKDHGRTQSAILTRLGLLGKACVFQGHVYKMVEVGKIVKSPKGYRVTTNS